MSVKIMIDSASDINEVEAKELGFLFIPIQVMLEDEEYLDGVNLLPETFFDKLPTCKTLPRTSLINSFRWDDEFEKTTKDGDDVVVITLSSKISGTYEAAVKSAEKFDGKIQVVDSLNAALGERLLGLYALELAKQKLSAKEIADKLNEQKNNVRIFAVIDTLEYLKKGGRISATTAFFGKMLAIKPVIGVINGKVEVIGSAKGNKKGNLYLNSTVEESGKINFDMPFGLLYSGNDKTNIEKYKISCAYLFEGRTPDTYPMGCTIGTHVGPGAVGIAYFIK